MNGESQKDRIRLAATIARHALEQLLREAKEGLGDEARTELLLALYDDVDPTSSVLGRLGDVLNKVAEPLREIDDEDLEDVACQLDEAAGHIHDSAGIRLDRARATLVERTGP
ncbi:hypothetical protein [Streptomyces sp. NPDC050164]|uniref:hypothetical protein n=1 Tax=Streptomyces sp. NPDC050164 TaxID=3365605 RepID=UPI0037AB15D2